MLWGVNHAQCGTTKPLSISSQHLLPRRSCSQLLASAQCAKGTHHSCPRLKRCFLFCFIFFFNFFFYYRVLVTPWCCNSYMYDLILKMWNFIDFYFVILIVFFFFFFGKISECVCGCEGVGLFGWLVQSCHDWQLVTSKIARHPWWSLVKEERSWRELDPARDFIWSLHLFLGLPGFLLPLSCPYMITVSISSCYGGGSNTKDYHLSYLGRGRENHLCFNHNWISSSPTGVL